MAKTPKIERYCVVENGASINVVLWDGVEPLTLPAGQTLVKEASAPARRVEEIAPVQAETTLEDIKRLIQDNTAAVAKG